MTTTNNTVFISYRRDPSMEIAIAVRKDLIAAGFDVFLDTESLGSGNFAEKLLGEIASRHYFVLILAQTSLERCVDPNDLFRREIEQALKTNRNIAMLYVHDFNMQANRHLLVGDLAGLSEYNGMILPVEHFDDIMQKFRRNFLHEEENSTAAVGRHLKHIGLRSVPSEALVAEGYFFKGLDAVNRAELDEAVRYYRTALDIKPDYSEALSCLC